MIQQLIEQSGLHCTGGFIAYYNDMSLYVRDPACMFSRAIAILVCQDELLLICPVDLTTPEVLPDPSTLRPIARSAFGSRSTGALFAQGCYFSIRDDALAGSYQISDDRIVSNTFSNARAYRKFLLK